MTHTPRILALVTTVALALSIGALFAVPAQGGNVRSATVALPGFAGDTIRAIGSARITGQVDSTCWAWGIPNEQSTPATVRRCYPGARERDTIIFVRPPTAKALTVAPLAYFKNKVSAAKNVAITVAPYDWPAPVVDSLKIDTLPKADSVDVVMYRTDGTQKFEFNGATYMTEGDTLVAVAKAFKGGTLVPRAWLEQDPVRWSTESVSGGVLRVVPIDRHGNDTALVIAVSCGCKESGDTINPPTLRPSPNGLKYSVRDDRGGWRDVTPIPANPFRAAP